VPANTLAELRRDMARLSFVKQQIKEIETIRAKRLEQTHGQRRTAMVRLLARVVGVGVESHFCASHERTNAGLESLIFTLIT